MDDVTVVTLCTTDRFGRLAGQSAAVDRHLPGARYVVAVMEGHDDLPDALSGARRVLGDDAVVLGVPHEDGGRFRLAAARNAALDPAAREHGGTLLCLDVDCVPGPRTGAALGVLPGGTIGLGPVTYLPERAGDPDPGDLDALTDPHPARPFPPDGSVSPCPAGEYARYFWSLCFAVAADDWRTIRGVTGGFHEGYVGYGAEDTDFGHALESAGVPLVLLGGAHVYHRYHPPTRMRPEVLDDLVRNGALHARRWGEWPMEGWFRELEAEGRVRRSDGGWELARDG